MKTQTVIAILYLIFCINPKIEAEPTRHFKSDSLPMTMNDLALKIVIIDKKVYCRSKKVNYPYFFSIYNSVVKRNYVPVIWAHDSFNHIEGAWDILGNEIWAVNDAYIATENFYCADVISTLLKIPLKDTSIWNHSKKILNRDSLTQLVFSYPVLPTRLPINVVFMEKYSIRAYIALAQKDKFINFRTIKDSLLANTYFNFLLSSKKEPLYFLLTEGELSIWKIGKDSDGIFEWQIIKKYPMPKFSRFHCFEKDEKLYILTEEGILYLANKKKLKKIKHIDIKNFDDQILVVDKDKNTISLLNKSNLTSLEELEKAISTKSINLF